MMLRKLGLTVTTVTVAIVLTAQSLGQTRQHVSDRAIPTPEAQRLRDQFRLCSIWQPRFRRAIKGQWYPTSANVAAYKLTFPHQPHWVQVDPTRFQKELAEWIRNASISIPGKSPRFTEQEALRRIQSAIRDRKLLLWQTQAAVEGLSGFWTITRAFYTPKEDREASFPEGGVGFAFFISKQAPSAADFTTYSSTSLRQMFLYDGRAVFIDVQGARLLTASNTWIRHPDQPPVVELVQLCENAK